jgi:hypothetical protein
MFGPDGGSDIIHGDGGEDTLDLSAMADAGIGWTISLEDGSEISGTGDGYLDLSNDAAGTINFDDGSSVEFDGLDKIEW